MKRKAPRKGTPAQKPGARMVRCRRCKWAVALEASRTDKKGSGWRKLWEHVVERHPRYLKEVRKWSRRA